MNIWTNCPNCGAPIKMFDVVCEYCGSIVKAYTDVDISEVILYADDKPVMVIHEKYP